MKKTLLTTAMIVMSVFLFLNLALAGQWYDFGNGKINLENVKFIVPKISLSYHPALKQNVKKRLAEGGYTNNAQFEKEGGIIGMFKSLGNNPEGLKDLTDEACVSVDFGSWTNPLTENDIEVVINSLKPQNLQCYEDVQVSGYVMFDDFKLELYSFSKEKITKENIKDIEKGLKSALKAYQKID